MLGKHLNAETAFKKRTNIGNAALQHYIHSETK